MNARSLFGRGPLAVAGATAALVIGFAGPAGASSSASASVTNDTLTVAGTSGADRLALRLAAGDPNTLEVDFDDDGSADHSFDRSTFSSIEVSLRSGSDRFRVDQANGVLADEALRVDGGSGDDTMDGGDAAEVFYGQSGNDAVDGNRGNDTAYLGSGTDSFRWDPGDGSDTIEGDSGTDTLDFNGAGANEVMSLTPNGRRALFLRDVADIRMDMDNVERLDLTALEGTDTVTVDDMTGTDFRQADIDLSGSTGGGDGAADLVTVNGTDRADNITVATDGARVDVTGGRTDTTITGAETIDQLQVNGQGGNDTVDVDADVNAVIGVAVDLGAGQI
jgi:RTX calcium-binding nonapeptide repeat (4 copies)